MARRVRGKDSIKLDYVLDTFGTTEKKIAVCVYGKAAGDQ
jgi:hypothetical protein